MKVFDYFCWAVSIFSSHKQGLRVIKLFSCSTQLNMKFIMTNYVKMPAVVDILIFISMIKKPSESLKARKVFIFLLVSMSS